MKLLEKMDLLSKKIMLKMYKSENYSSKIGIIASFAIYCCILLVTIYYLNKIFSSELQSILKREEYAKESPIFNFTNFVPFSIRIEDDNGNLYENKSMFEIGADYVICKKESNRNYPCNYTKLNLTRCNVNKFPLNYKDNFEINMLNESYCIDFDSNPNLNNSLIIKGSWEENSTIFIKFYSKLCSNPVDKCITNKTFLDKYLFENFMSFSFYSFEENFVPNNYSFPSEILIKNTFFNLNVNTNKVYRSMLTYTVVESDIGLLSEIMNQTKLISNEIYFKDVSPLMNYDIPILDIVNVNSYNKIIKVERHYLKLQNVLTIINTIIHFSVIICQIILNPFINKIYHEEIITQILSSKTLKHKEFNNVKILQNNVPDGLAIKSTNHKEFYKIENSNKNNFVREKNNEKEEKYSEKGKFYL